MYVTRGDAGMSWSGSSCTGGRSLIPWNNRNTSGYVAVGTTYQSDGPGNTATEVATDSDSGSAGTQPHLAAQYCDTLSEDGHSDWYLPAKGELNTIYTNKAAIGNFDTGGTYYWSSSEYNNGGAWVQRFSDGYQGLYDKFNTYAVRCARR